MPSYLENILVDKGIVNRVFAILLLISEKDTIRFHKDLQSKPAEMEHENMRKKSRIQSIVYMVMVAVCLSGCGQTVVEEEPVIKVDISEEEADYQMEEVTRGDVILTKNISSNYVQTKAQEIAFTKGGQIIDKVYVKEGDKVAVGDLLVELQNGNLEDEIADLEYAIRRTELQYGYLDVYEKFDLDSAYYTFVSSTDMEEEDLEEYEKEKKEIQDGYKERREDFEDTLYFDRLKLEQKKAELSSNRIYATMDGTVISMEKDLEGSTAKRDQVIMLVVDNSNGLFETEDEEIAAFIEEDTVLPMVIVYGTAKGDYEVVPYKKETWGEKQMFQAISEPEGATLEVGTAGTITAVVDQKENVLRISKQALYQADGKYYVYMPDEAGLKQVRFIEIGLIGDAYVEVVNGITDGEKVIKK